MAHKKGVGSSRNGRDSNPKMLGVKKFGGEKVSASSIIVRQKVLLFIRALMSERAQMIHCLPKLTVLSGSQDSLETKASRYSTCLISF